MYDLIIFINKFHPSIFIKYIQNLYIIIINKSIENIMKYPDKTHFLEKKWGIYNNSDTFEGS